MSDCIFCKIINGEIPCDKVFESDKLIGFKDIHPAAPTHILFVPKKHYATLNDIPENEFTIITDLTKAVIDTAKKLGVDETGYRVITNVNRGAGQEVFHVHTHLLAGRALGKMG